MIAAETAWEICTAGALSNVLPSSASVREMIARSGAALGMQRSPTSRTAASIGTQPCLPIGSVWGDAGR